MAGLFSRLDALLRVPMSDLLDRMELAPELRAALSSREGPYARVLGLVESYEAGAWDVVQAGATGLGVSFDVLPALYAQAVTWAREQAAEATGG
jgi:EAL and modified HD-GYP domain-containing signal transduction protein